MRGSWLKKLTGFVVAAALLTGIAGTAFAAGVNASQSSFLSDYTCDFENNYYPGQGASVVPEGDGNVYRMTVDTNGENHKLEIYNSTLGDFTLTDGNIYAVTLKYKVENISAAEKGRFADRCKHSKKQRLRRNSQNKKISRDLISTPATPRNGRPHRSFSRQASPIRRVTTSLRSTSIRRPAPRRRQVRTA